MALSLEPMKQASLSLAPMRESFSGILDQDREANVNAMIQEQVYPALIGLWRIASREGWNEERFVRSVKAKLNQMAVDIVMVSVAPGAATPGMSG